tara:strand:+ start:31335 stop:31772 length:438 start_codon:yes stop_codon:yes gene_type:complete
MDIENAPHEVIEAMVACSWNGTFYCGEEQYKRINDTIKKYPEYFPWETKYNSISKEVHDKYKLAISQLHDTIYPKAGKVNDMIPGEGIFSYIRRQPVEPLTEKTIKDAFKYMFVTLPKQQSLFETEKRRIWNKFYKKYNLKYRDY